MFIKKSLLLLLVISGSSFLVGQVRFSTDFDSGSMGNYQMLDSVWIKRGANDSILAMTFEVHSRFDPLNPVDTALRPSARWYHFRMEGVKDKQIFLNIKNSEVIRPFYSYDGINYRRFEEVENIFKGSINKVFTRDTVYISHFHPYTYSRHKEKLNEWKERPFVSHEIIGESTQGLPIEMLVVTDPNTGNSNKKRVWIHGRSHPSEAPSSWHLEAMIDEIMSDTPFASELRRNTVFYLIPFINPDGVIGGYSRSTSTGVNIEINWDRPDSLTMPEVKALRKTLERITAEGPLDMLLNMHSQIASSITYWIHTAESTTDKFFREQVLLSALTINYSPYYRPVDQRFSAVAPRYVEGWIWDRFGEKTLAITFETPYTFYNEEREGTWVSLENLKELGYSSLYAVSDILNLDKQNRILIDPETNNTPRRWRRITENNHIFFGESFLVAEREGARLRYTFSNLPKGEYVLYRWNVGPAENTFPEDTNIWTEEAIVVQRRDGKFSYTVRAYEEGEKRDAILLIRRK